MGGVPQALREKGDQEVRMVSKRNFGNLICKLNTNGKIETS